MLVNLRSLMDEITICFFSRSEISILTRASSSTICKEDETRNFIPCVLNSCSLLISFFSKLWTVFVGTSLMDLDLDNEDITFLVIPSTYFLSSSDKRELSMLETKTSGFEEITHFFVVTSSDVLK